MKLAPILGLAAVCLLSVACDQTSPTTEQAEATAPTFEIPFEKYVLDNGLEVILHEDHSDPLVAVATLVHVGSNREKPGRTGFAHFFEHMSFNDSENVPRGSNRTLIEELGGTRNGGTWKDGTIYYEVVPTDAFEKVLWINSDRLGYMINTVTEAALEREKQVVKNEKRQRVDNVPYGHTATIIGEHLYPADHPYHWTTIGSLEDLQDATLSDVKEFYEKFYGAANSTLVIAGDIDKERTKKLVEQWFGEIRRGPEVPPMEPMPVELKEPKILGYEDNFAKLPELRVVYPTVAQFHKDAPALDLLARALTDSKTAPLYSVIVEEEKLAPRVIGGHGAQELAGEMAFIVRAADGIDLDQVKAAFEKGLARFEEEGMSEDELQRLKTELELGVYSGFTSVLDKAFQLASFNEYAGDPGYLSEEVRRVQALTRDDIMSAFQRYMKGRPFIMTSVVPKGSGELMVEGTRLAEVVEEKIVQGAEAEVSEGEEAVVAKTPSQFDRSEPDLGEPPTFVMPGVWKAELGNGLRVLGIESSEVPLVAFDLVIEGGHLLDPANQPGVASLVAEMMIEGTAERTPAELEKALGHLGATLNITASAQSINLRGETLARNFDATMALVQEVLVKPRWDEVEFDRLVRERKNRLRSMAGNAQSVAFQVANRLVYGDEHILGRPTFGTLESVESLTLDDLKAYYAANVSPKSAALHVVGLVNQSQVTSALAGLSDSWQGEAVESPDWQLPESHRGGQVYFVDLPGAKQSVIIAGKMGLSGADDDYNNVIFANQRLGGGSSGRLFQLLRIQKGYTYGAYSFMPRWSEPSPFFVQTSVRSNVTLESLELIQEQLRNYSETFTDEDAEVTKNRVVKSNTRSFESPPAKLGLLRRISRFGLSDSFLEEEMEELKAMSTADFQKTIDTYLKEGEMFYLVVGDAATQLDRVAKLGYGKPTMLDIHGEPVSR